MTITLRWAHLAVAGAFLAGVLLTVVVAQALTSGDSPSPSTLGPAPTATAAPTREPPPSPTTAPSPVPSETPVPTAPAATPTPPAVPTTVPAPAQVANPEPVQTPAPPQPGSGYAFIGVVWADDFIPVPYCVNANNPPIDSAGNPLMSPAQFTQAVQAAFQTWQNVPGSYIAFVYTGPCSNDPFDTRDQTNTVGWGWLFSTAIGAAAPSATHGEFLRQSTFGQIYELDIVVDVRYAQSFDDEAEYIQQALPWILLHEIGHFIGLDHVEDPCSIMQPVIIEATPALCEVDRAGARALYPES